MTYFLEFQATVYPWIRNRIRIRMEADGRSTKNSDFPNDHYDRKKYGQIIIQKLKNSSN